MTWQSLAVTEEKFLRWPLATQLGTSFFGGGGSGIHIQNWILSSSWDFICLVTDKKDREIVENWGPQRSKPVTKPFCCMRFFRGIPAEGIRPSKETLFSTWKFSPNNLLVNWARPKSKELLKLPWNTPWAHWFWERKIYGESKPMKPRRLKN